MFYFHWRRPLSVATLWVVMLMAGACFSSPEKSPKTLSDVIAGFGNRTVKVDLPTGIHNVNIKTTGNGGSPFRVSLDGPEGLCHDIVDEESVADLDIQDIVQFFPEPYWDCSAGVFDLKVEAAANWKISFTLASIVPIGTPVKGQYSRAFKVSLPNGYYNTVASIAGREDKRFTASLISTKGELCLVLADIATGDAYVSTDTIDIFDASRCPPGMYFLEVSGQGEWSVAVSHPRILEPPFEEIKGMGPEFIKVNLPEGSYSLIGSTLNMGHYGWESDYLRTTLFPTGQRSVDCFIPTDPYLSDYIVSGTVRISIDDDCRPGEYLIMVDSGTRWGISLQLS